MLLKKTPFQLLLLPFVAMKEVIQEMGFREVLAFSLISPRCKKIIQTCRLKLSRVEYNVPGSRTEIKVIDWNLGESWIKVLPPDSTQTEDVKPNYCDLFSNRFFGLSFSSVRQFFARAVKPEYGDLLSNRFMGFWRRDLMELINLISSLYQPFECSIEGDPKDILERLPIIENVQYTCLSFAKSKVIDKFFDTYPNQKSTRIAGIIGEKPKPDSKFYEVGEVELDDSFSTTTHRLQNFKGHYLIIKNSCYHKSDIIQFIKKWILGEDHLNIEAVRLISNMFTNFNRQSNMREFVTMRWNEKRRPREYVYKKGYSSVWEMPTDCAEFLDVERKTDGKIASFSITADDFTFLVWN